MEAFPYVEFPLFSSGDQAAGQQRQYLESRINCAAAGSFSAAAVSRSGELTFRRNGTPYDPLRSAVATNVVSQVTYFQWNYKDVYIPPRLLHGFLTEATSQEDKTAAYDPLLGSAVASLNYNQHTCLFYASGPLLQTLACGLLSPSHNSLSLREIEGFQLPGRILEVQVSQTQGKAFVCARTSYHIAFFQGPTEEDISSIVSSDQSSDVNQQVMTLLGIYETDHAVASVVVSPYLAGEGLIVTETGGVYQWQHRQPLQTLKKPTSLSGPSHFWRCCYGGHPRSLVLAEHSRVSLGDFRSGQLSLSALVETPSEWLPNKSLISAISPSSHPHQFHISTSHSLLLLDTRQPHWPLLEQSHDLGHAPQVLSTTGHPSVLSEQLVMLSDCSAGESLVFSVATPTDSPPFVNFSPHTVATYSELENTWKGRPALPLIGQRLRLPMGGACLVALGDSQSNVAGGTRGETFAAFSLSVWGDLFYQLWSYCKTPPTAPPTSNQEDSWLQEALQQEQELQVSGEEWLDTAAPVNFKPLLQYLYNDLAGVLCASCLLMSSSHPSLPSPLPPTSTPSQTTPSPPTPQQGKLTQENTSQQATPTAPIVSETTPTPPIVSETTPTPPIVSETTPTPPIVSKTAPTPPIVSETTPTDHKCVFCGGHLAPLRTIKLQRKLVSEGLLEETMETDSNTMTSRGLHQLRSKCVFTEPGTDSSHDDHLFWEGWREEGTDDAKAESSPPPSQPPSQATPTKTPTSAAAEKPYTPTSSQKSRKRSRGMGF